MSKKVLIVDDDPTLVAYLRTLLEDNGYSVVTAENGEEGLEKTRSERPDLVSLDLLMPEKTGIKMFRELRKDAVLKNTPVVMVTGIANECQTFAEFKTFISKRKIPGPEAYLEKPINQDEYLSTIREITA